jgi:hypothetical protein
MADTAGAVMDLMDALADHYEGHAMLETDDTRRATLLNQSVAYRVVLSDLRTQLNENS